MERLRHELGMLFPSLRHGLKSNLTCNKVSYDGRKEHAFTGVIVHPNLARTKIHITWQGVEPALTCKDEQSHYPPPQNLSSRELEKCRKLYNEKIAKWCEKQLGTQVGNGECWTLANEALKETAKDCKNHGKEECMACIGFVHGSLIYENKFGIGEHPIAGVKEAGVSRGDILQFYDCKFEGLHGWKFAGSPDHTAVIREVMQDGRLTVLEQNNGQDKIVREGHYILGELVKGEVRVFRPVGVGWMGDLSPCWP